MPRGFFVACAAESLALRPIAVAYNTETPRPETREAALDKALRDLDLSSPRMALLISIGRI
jgi:hypothetical protein